MALTRKLTGDVRDPLRGMGAQHALERGPENVKNDRGVKTLSLMNYRLRAGAGNICES